MIYKTKYFGQVECDASALFHFPVGLPGFEEEHDFLLLPFQESDGALFSLQSAATPELSFLVMDPFALLPDYEPELSGAELEQLGVADWRELSFCVLCATREPVSSSTVNLKCPIALRLDTHCARQIIMDSPRYGMRHPLAEFSQGKESSPC